MCRNPAACLPPNPIEAFVLDLLFRPLALAPFLAALLFAAPETDSVFCRSRLGLGTPAPFAILVEIDDHPAGTPLTRRPRAPAPSNVACYVAGAISLLHR